jgi:hypothetical protein
LLPARGQQCFHRGPRALARAVTFEHARALARAPRVGHARTARGLPIGQLVWVPARVRVDRGLRARAHARRERAAAHGERARAAAEHVERVPAGARRLRRSRLRARTRTARPRRARSMSAGSSASSNTSGGHRTMFYTRLPSAPRPLALSARALSSSAPDAGSLLNTTASSPFRPPRVRVYHDASVPLTVSAPSPTPPSASAYGRAAVEDAQRAQAAAAQARLGVGLAPRPRTGTGMVYRRTSAVYTPTPRGAAPGHSGGENAAGAAHLCMSLRSSPRCRPPRIPLVSDPPGCVV